jgi:signal transduction histidine kinase
VAARTETLRQSNVELEQALATKQAMQAELVRSEKMAALGSLVAGVAHELNTPIGNSVTVASTLQFQLDNLDGEMKSGNIRRASLQNYLDGARHGHDILLRSLHRAAHLVGSFKRVAVDQSSDLRRTFDLATALEEISTTLGPMYKKGPYTLELSCEGGIAMDSYPGALGQCITNFVSNALQHAFEHRDSGHMRLEAVRLTPDTVYIRFSDDGIGMDADTQKRVFDPFFTTKLGQGGSGLGMNIVYNLVHGVLGGHIHVTSTPGSGSCITMNLPCQAPAPSAATQENDQNSSQITGST